MPLGGLQYFTIEPQDEKTRSSIATCSLREWRPAPSFPATGSGGQATVHLMGPDRDGIVVRGTDKKQRTPAA